eukprot:CAMPEP_0204517430 /NCGR_PEP_ID=MMETSP0661-20131031/3664_1 /ASSEMBLY_ACC=CAM_ASM_000606 /TAXON_ID=109239 /ORGANISM="Alexandrium margalefi, Strain AMGDE01CS-322" /LENGTH=84 /DNA_ID=CAMNT_0051522829 /DNA_START=46 /DNA_END=300 /DNA_ORIENTATION=-
MSGSSLEVYEAGKAIAAPGSHGRYTFDRMGFEQRFIHWRQTGEKAPYAPVATELDSLEGVKPTISADLPAQVLPKEKRSSLIFY